MALTITGAQLRAMLPAIPAARFTAALAGVNTILAEASIDTPHGAAMLVAQLGHESGSFRYLVELADGLAYEPGTRVGARLGNTEPGDGPRYKGRGWIQLTGRANYRAAGQALGLPLEEQPELAAEPATAARTAAWFWRSRGLSDVAGLDLVTRRINGGLNGIKDRRAKYEKCCAALGVQP